MRTSLTNDWGDFRKQTFTIFFLLTFIPLIIFYYSDWVVVLESIGISFMIGFGMAYADYLWEIGLTIFVFLILFISFFVVFTLIGVFLNFTNSYVIMGIAVICSILGITLSKHRQITILYRLRYHNYNYYNEQAQEEHRKQADYWKNKKEEAHAEAERMRELHRSRYIREKEFLNLPSRIESLDEAYALFNLSATEKEIKNTYRRLTKFYHPDLTHENTNREMQLINQAYELILRTRKA